MAQRTIMNSATIGIFRMTSSQMKVQVVTQLDFIPTRGSAQGRDPHPRGA
jgi:hypothetical protein